MSEKVIIRAFVSTWIVGSEVKDDYVTDYTKQEWEALTESEREEIIEQYRLDQISNFMDSGAWVKDENDKD